MIQSFFGSQTLLGISDQQSADEILGSSRNGVKLRRFEDKIGLHDQTEQISVVVSGERQTTAQPIVRGGCVNYWRTKA